MQELIQNIVSQSQENLDYIFIIMGIPIYLFLAIQ